MSRAPDTEPEAQKQLDDLVAKFEEDMRRRPTPAELGESEEAAPAAPKRKPAQRAKAAAALSDRTAEPLIDMTDALAAAEAPPPPDAKPVPEPTPAAETPAPAVPEPAAPAPNVATGATVVVDLETWWAAGERIELELPGGVKRSIFTRILGEGPWLTMIHGFPTSSWDWAPMAPELARHHRLLTFDLLGFGDSDKPVGHNWSAFEQADIVEALWRHFGVTETRVVAHDVGLTVSLELLAREAEGKLATRMIDYTLLNGGVYTGFHRPRPIQVWLQRPVIGALISQLMSEGRFSSAIAETFSAAHQPTPEDLHQHWTSVRRRGGEKTYHRLIKYIPERRANKDRWEAAVENTPLPIRFVWGMADPISGAHMADVIKERRPGADFVELADVGHFPQLEEPDLVARAIIEGPRPRP